MKQEAIMATTHVDRHFHRFTKQALEGMAEDISGEARPIVNVEHDSTIPPIGKILEVRVVLREDGEYQLVTVQEIFEETLWTEFEDGTKLFKQECETDRHPFLDKYAGMPKGYGLSYDAMNFDDGEAIELFIREVQIESQVEFSTGMMGRKSQIPDPEIIVRIAEAVTTCLVIKKVVDKVGDKLLDLAATEVAKFYSFIRSVVVSAIKYARPKGRPITYVFVAYGDPTIEFVIRSTNADTVLHAIVLNKLESALTDASRFHELFGAARIQYLLNENGDWEFNYLLTNRGAIIGTDKSFSKRMQLIQLLTEKVKEPGSVLPSVE